MLGFPGAGHTDQGGAPVRVGGEEGWGEGRSEVCWDFQEQVTQIREEHK